MAEDFLEQMTDHGRTRAVDTLARGDDILKAVAASPQPAPLVLDGFSLIAEVKLRAPSVGQLAAPDDPEAAAVAQAQRYVAAGAAAISVLTEPHRFDGAMSHLTAVAGAVDTPVMRKDFLLDPIQIAEARVGGASGVLLITRMLTDRQLDGMLYAANHAGLFVLVESFDEDDLVRTAAAIERRRGYGPDVLVGVNTRDLATLQVDPDRLERLAHLLPDGVPAVAESGIRTPEDAAKAARLGYSVALVGSALMSSDDPTALAADMVAAGSEALGC